MSADAPQMFAGHETTTISLTWALYRLAENPVIQQRLREEVSSVEDSSPDL